MTTWIYQCTKPPTKGGCSGQGWGVHSPLDPFSARENGGRCSCNNLNMATWGSVVVTVIGSGGEMLMSWKTDIGRWETWSDGSHGIMVLHQGFDGVLGSWNPRSWHWTLESWCWMLPGSASLPGESIKIWFYHNPIDISIFFHREHDAKSFFSCRGFFSGYPVLWQAPIPSFEFLLVNPLLIKSIYKSWLW